MRSGIYVASRREDGQPVLVCRRGSSVFPLDPRFDLNVFAEVYGWGAGDVLGGLQTAQAILGDALQRDYLVSAWTVDFWRYCIAVQEVDGFTLTLDEIVQWICDAVLAELSGEVYPQMKGGTDG